MRKKLALIFLAATLVGLAVFGIVVIATPSEDSRTAAREERARIEARIARLRTPEVHRINPANVAGRRLEAGESLQISHPGQYVLWDVESGCVRMVSKNASAFGNRASEPMRLCAGADTARTPGGSRLEVTAVGGPATFRWVFCPTGTQQAHPDQGCIGWMWVSIPGAGRHQQLVHFRAPWQF